LRDRKAYPDSKIAQTVALGGTKATNIVKHVVVKAHSEELTHILKSVKFSFLIGESTDKGDIKTVCICVRYFDRSSKLSIDFGI